MNIRTVNQPLLEGCVDSYASGMAAFRGGADRLELCANLAIHVLIRPRFGDFLYNPQELEEMYREIERFRDLGADGVVIGVLTPQGELDLDNMRRMIDCAGDLSVTLHRAFDMTRDPYITLESAIALGCRTVLTSGQANSAYAGRDLLRELFHRAAGRIDVMAGAGVKSGTIPDLFQATGIRVFHTSARREALDSGMLYRKDSVSMGLPSLSEYEIWRTSEDEVRACAQIVHALAACK